MHDYYYTATSTISRHDRRKWLAAIVNHLNKYERALLELQSGIHALTPLNDMLNAPINWGDVSAEIYFDGPISLCTPGKFVEAIQTIDANLGLDIKTHRNFPIYFLYRFKINSYQHHYILIEEIYRSKFYDIMDKRFIRLRPTGYERILLNTLPCRDQVAKRHRMKKGKSSDRRINQDVNQIAKILNLAWDEDLELTRKICKEFELSEVMAALELTTLILCTDDVSWLKNQNKVVVRFFTRYYDHPYIGIFLNKIKSATSTQWRGKVDQAKRNYVLLRKSITQLFKSKISYHGGSEIALWKLAFASHNHKLPSLTTNKDLRQRIAALEEVASDIIENN